MLLSQRVMSTPEIGQIIKQRRKEKGVTQTTLAQFSGVSTHFLSDLENGKASCEVSKVLEVLSMLGLNIIIESRG